jgi:glycerol uptake facilitator protein
MGAKFFGEFMGTLVLILLGNGVVANVSLRHSKAEGAGWMAIAAGWAFAVMAGSFTATACGSPDSHLNPAMTLGMAIVSGDFSKVSPSSRRSFSAPWPERSPCGSIFCRIGR